MDLIAYVASIIAILALVCDWMQTLHCSRHASHLFEVNIFLGPRPSPRRVNVYFAMSTTALLAALAALISLGKFELAVSLAGFLAALELCCVVNNWSLGIAPGCGARPSNLRNADPDKKTN